MKKKIWNYGKIVPQKTKSVKMYDDEPKYGGTQSFSTVDANGFPILFTVEGE